MALHMIKEFLQPGKTGRPPDKTAMQPYRHHLWGGIALGIQRIECINQIGGKLVPGMKALCRGKAHVVGVQRIGDNQMRAVGLATPERQVIGIVICIIQKAAFLGDKHARMLRCAARIPAQRAGAADGCVDVDGLLQMRPLLIHGHAVIIDPAIAMRGNLVTIGKGTLDDCRMTLHGHRHREQCQRHIAVTEKIKQPPDPAA